MATYTAEAYRQSLFGNRDDLFTRCLLGSAALGLLLLVVVILAPARRQAITNIAQLPERFAKLIIEEPKPTAEIVRPAEAIETAEEVAPEVEPEPAPLPRQPPRVDPDAGRAGRERARELIAA